MDSDYEEETPKQIKTPKKKRAKRSIRERTEEKIRQDKLAHSLCEKVKERNG